MPVLGGYRKSHCLGFFLFFMKMRAPGAGYFIFLLLDTHITQLQVHSCSKWSLFCCPVLWLSSRQHDFFFSLHISCLLPAILHCGCSNGWYSFRLEQDLEGFLEVFKTLLGSPMQGQELELVIPVSPCQLWIFCDSMLDFRLAFSCS